MLMNWAEVSELDLIYRLRQISLGSSVFLSITIFFYFVLLLFLQKCMLGLLTSAIYCPTKITDVCITVGPYDQ